MTVTAARRSANHWPGLDVVPTGPRASVSAAVARRLFAAAVNRLDVTVHVGDQTLGLGGPAMTVHRPQEFFARIGRHQLIGFGEAGAPGSFGAAHGSPGAAALPAGPASEQSFDLDRPLREARDAFEKSYFEFHLAREGGSMTRVAEKTGLERTHLYRKLKQLGVEPGKLAKKGG